MEHQERRKNLDETSKGNINVENAKQLQQKRKNIDETIKKNNQAENTKQH